MTSTLQTLAAEAKKGRFSAMNDSIYGMSEDDIVSVWENISSFVEKQMGQLKGVTIPGLGTFTFSQQKLDVGNNKHLLMQRPVFVPAEKFVQHHGLHYNKHFVPGHIPTISLNYAALAFESPFDRDTVENCVKEILHSVAKAVNAKRNVELTFSGIGRLSIRDSKIKMKFFKMFVNQMDGSGKLLDSLQNRPGTVDSVISDRCPSRPYTANTLVLPKISSFQGNNSNTLAPVVEQDEDISALPREPFPDPVEVPEVTDTEPQLPVDAVDVSSNFLVQEANKAVDPPGIISPPIEDTMTNLAYDQIMNSNENQEAAAEPITTELPEAGEGDARKSFPPSRGASRMAMPLPKASGISFWDDLAPGVAHSPKLSATPKPAAVGESLDGPHLPFGAKPRTPPRLAPLHRSMSAENLGHGLLKPPTPPGSACGHPNAGQELCYLCHQRSRRNLPVSFAEEKKKREEEEEKLLQQYNVMKDAEETLKEQEKHMTKRHDLQKIAAFNLGVAEAVNDKKKARDSEVHKSYIFHQRPLTPPRFPKQVEYANDLAKQVDSKTQKERKHKADEQFLERLEQVQLAEDLAAQREVYLREKAEQRHMYQNALEAQLRFRPVQLPPREPDSEIFGKNDVTNEKMAEKRRRAYELFQEQQDLVANRKREAILKRLAEQKQEEEILHKTRKELLEDRADRFRLRYDSRKRLENDWFKAATKKRSSELEDRLQSLTPGLLVHEQCDKYRRCGQCQRKLRNCGESNIWSESRYIPGSRLMV